MSGPYRQPGFSAVRFSEENLSSTMGIPMLNTQAHHHPHAFSGQPSHFQHFDISPTVNEFSDENADNRIGEIPNRPPIKHRRSRSGCLTCRQRRVKCDEVRPGCERCRKGGRKCQYPGQTPSATSNAWGATSDPIREESGSSPDESDDAQFPNFKFTSSDDHNGNQTQQSRSARGSIAESGGTDAPSEPSETPSLVHERSISPSSDGSESATPRNLNRSQRRLRQPAAATNSRADLHLTMQYYLMYFRGHLTHHHYGLKYDNYGFLHDYLLEEAGSNEALLHAVVAFAAYHHSLPKPNGKLQDFLGFYTKSLSLLRRSLETEQKFSVATLLTILQLALLEEYLGDWTNLVAHQKAAYTILTGLFTPQTIMVNDTLSKVLEWYLRFDLFAGFMSGTQPTLSRDWSRAQHEYYIQQVRKKPDNIGYKFEERICCARVLATDVNYFFAIRSQGIISNEDLPSELNHLRQRFFDWYRDMDSSLRDPSKLIKNFPKSSKIPDPEDIVDPFDTNLLYGDDLWPMNFILLDFLALELMFQYQAALSQRQQPPPPELYTTALKICQLFEAIEYHNQTPGVIIANQAPLAFAPLFLPKTEKFTLWFRKKYTSIESLGYIHPASFRQRLSNAWGIDVTRDWLPSPLPASNFPDDQHPNGNLPAMVRRIRTFIDYRTQSPKSDSVEPLRDLSGIFNDAPLEDGTGE